MFRYLGGGGLEYNLNKENVLSFRCKEWLFSNIIDIWAVLLNQAELNGKRLFLSSSHSVSFIYYVILYIDKYNFI